MMKKQVLMLLMAAMSLMACSGNGKKAVASTNEEETEATAPKEVAQPIGDRAWYQVHGNVRTITFVQGCEEDKTAYETFEDNGYDAKMRRKIRAFVQECSITNSVTFDENGKSVSAKKEFFIPEDSEDGTVYKSIFISDDPVYGGDWNLVWRYGVTFTYDHEGKLVETGGYEWGTSFEYDDNHRIVKEEVGSEGYIYETVFTYDEDGNCVRKDIKEAEESMEGIQPLGTSVVTYTILEKDSHGNWTKRKSDGGVDERTITYY